VDHAFDEVEVDGEEGTAGGHSGVVDEQVDRRVALEDPRGHRIDGLAVGDVAHLHLAVDLVGERAEPVLAARDEDAPPALLRQKPRRCLADPRRRAGDDRDPDGRGVRIAGRRRPDAHRRNLVNTRSVFTLISTVSRMSSA
jgi:hypothetical protein